MESHGLGANRSRGEWNSNCSYFCAGLCKSGHQRGWMGFTKLDAGLQGVILSILGLLCLTETLLLQACPILLQLL